MNRSHDDSIERPTQMMTDELSLMSDDELSSYSNSLERSHEKYGRMSSDTRPWEEEICYVQREYQVRRIQHDNHQRYMRERDAELQEEIAREDSLPDADLDNSRYVNTYLYCTNFN